MIVISRIPVRDQESVMSEHSVVLTVAAYASAGVG